MPDDALTVDYMMKQSWIVGDPEECAARICTLYEQVGGFGHLLAITQDPDDPATEGDRAHATPQGGSRPPCGGPYWA